MKTRYSRQDMTGFIRRFAVSCLEYESIRQQDCLMLSLAAGLKQPYTDSPPLVDGLSPPRQPQRDIQYRESGLVLLFTGCAGVKVRSCQAFSGLYGVQVGSVLKVPAGSLQGFCRLPVASELVSFND